MIGFLSLFFHLTSVTTCYQRLPSHTHNNVGQNPTHLSTAHNHYPHRWNEPYFDLTMPKNITSFVGKSAYLGCRVKHLGNKTVAWIRHRDLHILTVGTYTYATDQRFQTSYHRDIDEWTLQIKWVQERDAGVYECQISTQPVRSFSVILTIVVPTATILGGPDLYVDRGSTINLTCVIKVSSEVPTHIFWYHKNKVLSEENSDGRLKFKTHKLEETKSTLLINDADLSDSGTYSCYPSNTELTSVRIHVLQGERPEAMQTSAVDAIKLHTNHFTIIIKIVATLVLLHILEVFIQRIDYVTRNIIVHYKILCNENNISNINMKPNYNGKSYDISSNTNSSSNRNGNRKIYKNKNWTNIGKQHCYCIYAMEDCVYFTTICLNITLKLPTVKEVKILERRKRNFLLIPLYSKMNFKRQRMPILLLQRPSPKLILNTFFFALNSTGTKIYIVKKEYSQIYKFNLR